MQRISICERDGAPADRLSATVRFDDGTEFPVEIRTPLPGEDDARLEWYFERYLRQPFLDNVLLRNAVDSIPVYGEALFAELFSNPEIATRYVRCRQDLARLQIEIEGSPTFHTLNWEALKDPHLPDALCLAATMVRRPRAKPHSQTPPDISSPLLRVLVVSARPYGAIDVGYRTISRPLIECLRQAQIPVKVDILRPGTFRSLSKHLESVRNRPGPAYYHIIHFDTHGALLTHAELNELETAEPPSSSQVFRYGRGSVSPYEGHKAFLFLEGEGTGKADAVEAGELADLLCLHQIPITILNACQSGKQVGAVETSLGSRLLEAGVQLVLAMRYSITVSAARILMRTLYQQLFDGADVATAIRAGRRELANRKSRRAYFKQEIELEDWLLPVIYQSAEVRLRLRPFTPEERQHYYEEKANLFPDPRPAYGFVGRDLEILQIERRILQHNILLVSGMGGAGKTTLLQHLAHWWQTTDFVTRVFYFGYDSEPWTAQRLCDEIARALLGQEEYHNAFAPLSAAAQTELLVEKLRGQRHLLILDNLESITGTHLAIAHGLPKPERQAVRKFLTKLLGGKTLVLLGSRSEEPWLAPGTFDQNIQQLRGLDPEAASVLAEGILERCNATHYRGEEALEHILQLLAGFPLALEVVLANLAHQTPGAILEALQGGLAGLDRENATERTQSILLCIEHSHGNLSPGAQRLLECIAPFSVVFDKRLTKPYSAHLQQQPSLAGLEFEQWDTVLEEATRWGLMSPDPRSKIHLHLQPVLPYFLRSKGNEPARAERRDAIDTAFRNHYDAYAPHLNHQLQSQDSRTRASAAYVVKLEYENFVHALQLRVKAQVSFANIFALLSDYFDVLRADAQGVQLAQQISWQVEVGYDDEALQGPLGMELFVVLHDLSNRYLRLERPDEAERVLRKCLDQLELCTQVPENHLIEARLGVTNSLALIAQRRRELDVAEKYFSESMRLAQAVANVDAESKALNNLGRIAEMRRDWPGAEGKYLAALQLKKGLNELSAAATYHNLAVLAKEQQQYQKALGYLEQAIAIYQRFNERFEQLDTWTELGSIHSRLGNFDQAATAFKAALKLAIEFNSLHAQGQAYHGLAACGIITGSFEQAAAYLEKAEALHSAAEDWWNLAYVLRDRARLAIILFRWDAAVALFERARKVFHQTKDAHEEQLTREEINYSLGLRDLLLKVKASASDPQALEPYLTILKTLDKQRNDPTLRGMLARTLGISNEAAVALLDSAPDL
jgi:tetratricopeptide (TPR) repeat protein